MCVWASIGIFLDGFGFRSKMELTVSAIITGLVLGVTQSTFRVIFASLIPIGYETILFCIYESGANFSSTVGPNVAGAIMANTNADNRFIFLFIFCEAVITVILFYFFVDHRQGMIDSGRLLVAPEEQTPGESEEGPKNAK